MASIWPSGKAVAARTCGWWKIFKLMRDEKGLPSDKVKAVLCFLLPAGRRNNAVHPQIFDELTVVVPGVNTVFDCNSESRRGALWPGRNIRSRIWSLSVINGCWRSLHVANESFR